MKGSYLWLLVSTLIAIALMHFLASKYPLPKEFWKENIVSILIWMEVVALLAVVAMLGFHEFMGAIHKLMRLGAEPAQASANHMGVPKEK